MEKLLFDIKTVSPDKVKAINAFSNVMRSESQPGEPPRSLHATETDLKSYELLEHYHLARWHIWHDGEIVAHLITQVEIAESNQHLMYIVLGVHPDYRRQGLASSFLPIVLETAYKHDRSLLLFVTNSTVPAGEQAAQKLGAEAALATHTNQLVLKDLDKNLMGHWIKEGRKNRDYGLELFTNPLPEAHIDEIITLMDVMNTAPKDDLDVEDQQLSKEKVRVFEKYLEAHEVQQWYLCARHASGELAGFTEVIWDPEEAHIVFQGDTGVLPKYRGHGLGKWLKASMAEKILTERPGVVYIRTGNADSNAPMLAINEKMGFKPYRSETTWQLDREKLKAYLNEKGLL
ncbi:MAG: GNAT family N-acetyltransferase [Trueperaceae bacterium]|nr:GNAT family N-acetyltransferase [Trueperaceae bacterium]